MTIQYQGDNTYRVWLSDGGWVDMKQIDLISIQDLEFEGSKLINLSEKIEDLRAKNLITTTKIKLIIDELIGIVDEKEFDSEEFNKQIELLEHVLD